MCRAPFSAEDARTPFDNELFRLRTCRLRNERAANAVEDNKVIYWAINVAIIVSAVVMLLVGNFAARGDIETKLRATLYVFILYAIFHFLSLYVTHAGFIHVLDQLRK